MTTLSDNEIKVEIDAGRLIRNADLDMLDGASYELRLGNVYYDLTENGARFQLEPGENALIKPGHRVVLITKEELDTPSEILVRIVSKGSLFSVGLSPVATYADPGFKGNLGIVTQNISDKYIELPQGEPIAKADFTQLSSPATRLYQGQHGFQLGIWPIKTHLQKTHQQIANDVRVLSEKQEALALLPVATRTVIGRMETTQLWTNIGLVIAIIVNSVAIFLVEKKLVDGLVGVITSLVAASIIGIGSVTTNLLRRNK
jgi:dCTP deaminase